ncbi:fanconi anemia group d2 protein [Holotrichia oblita]|uniref:Fanconi anemia group d2 protein n=1 Tax=Holotrichia oblita TaxID=644536 RepID=A0ACB9SQT9_HOLOL|nr:fanconi anemia group d2 protein [Holotrichia oblita]
MAKHIAATFERQEPEDDPEESLADISNLPSGAAQNSANLLELARNATSNIPELMGLSEIYEMAPRECTGRIREHLYTTRGPKKINDIPLYTQYCLNEDSELNENFHVNIAGLTMQTYPNTSAITLLASQFRMFRMLCSKYQGHLEAIDALLGCGVLLPETEDFPMYDRGQSKMVADSLFHCINWFREIISAFVRHSNKKLRVKLIKRIGHLVELEELLMECLKQIPDHKLPSSYFYDVLPSAMKGSPIKPKSDGRIKQPRKKLKKNTGEAIASILNDTTASTSATFIPTQKRKTPSSTATKRRTQTVPKPEFRELDTDLIILLKYPLNLNEEITPSPVITIHIKVFQYILNDITEKLNLVVNNKNLGMSNLGEINAVSLVTDCVKFAPKVFKNFQIISEELQKMSDKVGNVYDHVDLYTTEAKALKILSIYVWSILSSCLIGKEETSSSQSIKYFCRIIADKFIMSAGECLSLEAVVSFVKIIDALYQFNKENVEIKKKLTGISGDFLNRKWYNHSGDIDAGKLHNLNLDFLIKSYLDGANIKTIAGITETLQTQIKTLQNKDDYLEMMGCINKTNFPVLYKNICHFTLERVKIEIASLTNKEHLILWKTTATIMCGLMNISKIQDNKQNYLSFLQKSNAILKVFLSHGIPILEIMLKSKPDEVVEILRTLQTTTRFLHNLCCTSKLTKDSSIMAHVPKFKETLETLVFRVKAALVANDCTGAFWMGNLKNKCLDGEEILSQRSASTTVDESENGDVEDEELPLDDSEDDDDILGQHDETSTRNGDGRSASEVYD